MPRGIGGELLQLGGRDEEAGGVDQLEISLLQAFRVFEDVFFDVGEAGVGPTRTMTSMISASGLP